MKKFLKSTIILAACFLSFVNVTSAKDYSEAEIRTEIEKSGGGAIFPIGEPNTANEKHFTGKSYVAWLSNEIPMGNVTFIDGAHTFWHIHHKSCQILIAQSGQGYYQIWGEEPHELLPGQVVTIPEGVKHWHGAAPNSTFQHIAVMKPVEGITTEWLEEVDPRLFNSLKKPSTAQKMVQTAGRDRLSDFAPNFAHYNDDILFGEVWSRNDILSLHDRSLITVASFMGAGLLNNSFKNHLALAKAHGVTKEEMVEVITQLGFYAGWPKAWEAFGMAKEVYSD